MHAYRTGTNKDECRLSQNTTLVHEEVVHGFPILHVAEMWKRGDNNLIRVALVFIPFKQGK